MVMRVSMQFINPSAPWIPATYHLLRILGTPSILQCHQPVCPVYGL